MDGTALFMNPPLHALKRSIVLVGLMGVGKTSVGRRLAARLGLPFCDADAEIEHTTGCTIPELFARHGEPAFRDVEHCVVRRLLAGGPLVLATGGGAFMDPPTRTALREEAVTVWLRCDLPALLRRVSDGFRPLLQNGDPAEILQRLMAARYPIYAEADLSVDVTDGGPEAMTSKVHAALQAWQPPRRLGVSLPSSSYDVVIGEGLLARAGAHLAPVLPQKRCVVVTDETVAGLHLPALLDGLAQTGIKAQQIVVSPGEASKSLAMYGHVVDQLLEAKVERRTTVIALGGGVIGDLAGFAAATALRGLPFVQVPTTLLSQVDSSVGGKTGVNTSHGKNLVGAFHQPVMVLADIGTLGTLPGREMRAGYAEIAKAGLIGDASFFTWCEGHGAALTAGDPALLAEAVLRACAFKAAVVGGDERETSVSGGRALLNLGHTFGHALEAEVGYGDGLLHGEAVAVGLGMAFRLSASLGLCATADADRVMAHLASVGLASEPGMLNRRFSASRLIQRMRRDKKNHEGALRFVLAHGIGKAFTADVAEDTVMEFLRAEGCAI